MNLFFGLTPAEWFCGIAEISTTKTRKRIEKDMQFVDIVVFTHYSGFIQLCLMLDEGFALHITSPRGLIQIVIQTNLQLSDGTEFSTHEIEKFISFEYIIVHLFFLTGYNQTRHWPRIASITVVRVYIGQNTTK